MDYCERCLGEITDYKRKHNGEVVCKECFDKIPILTSEGIPSVNTEDWVKGWYENIGPQPIYIESKKQLFNECTKHGNLPRAFMKRNSQGPGWELKRR